VNGSDALLQTLRANGVTTVFANPGTSEMHLVDGLDRAPDMRGVLCLFEGVATGAADGYARVSGGPAATLLHLGPGLGNGFANLHNARRARVPLLNLVGDHATHHRHFDAPLQSDIESIARGLETTWVRTTASADTLAADAADAVGASYGPPGQVATLIIPADAAWGEISAAPSQWPIATRHARRDIDEQSLREAVTLLRTKKTVIFLGGDATDAASFAAAHAIAHACDTKVIMETFPTIFDHGAGVVQPDRLIYLTEFGQAQLAEFEAMVVIGTAAPVSFFAYPDLRGEIVRDGANVCILAGPGDDVHQALSALLENFAVAPAVAVHGELPGRPSGELTRDALAAALAVTLPEGVIITDESNTSGLHIYNATTFAPAHRVTTLTGGSIGYGLPVAVGAAMASGGRVLALEADGSFMYTPQALWTMARESLDVTVVALSNRSYAILNLERQRVGVAQDGSTSQRMLELDHPELQLADLARSMGVPAVRVTTADELVVALERSYATPGPMVIEAMLTRGLG
jgi:acetolactate synthase-1/2/3 large subunit